MILYRTPGRSFTRPPRTSTIECSCRLWPMPGIYVVTSTALVKRTRATFRSAEFGFLGVCVYTRMHTPRFSGQPINAGDLVLLRIPSLPRRISCANVGTVVPRFLRQRSQLIMRGHRVMRADTFCGLLRCAQTNTQEHTIMLKGLLRIRRDQQETPHALQEAELSSWYRIGEAYSAFRGWRPIPAALQSHSVDLVPGPKNSLPTSHPPLARGLTARSKIPLTKHKV